MNFRNSKRMPEVMNTWPSTATWLQAGRFQKGSEHAVNLPVDKRKDNRAVESKARLRAVPTDELVDGMTVRLMGTRRRERVRYRSLRLFKIREPQN
jgi:hypothetical protein